MVMVAFILVCAIMVVFLHKHFIALVLSFHLVALSINYHSTVFKINVLF